ncbi:hypothetical protein DFJ58DRAFT_728406 [Suillus subalutaceus]|uniref:uncharacterized protein n=1 Tax=Suillus subalutaceus TaxID=48586 RepID=UPI001B8835B2|nr:uncharacterized protein DFJ58DRAFT_728406 [Suillus subalutaceus]KAG1852755.1 hypothetical protein DFJ58DRAFT_728406 [Suillus subalutaceus]
MSTQCPNCLKSFAGALAVTQHLSQPLTSCLQRIDKLQSASQILLESGQHTTSSSTTTRRPSPVHYDFSGPMDFEVEPVLVTPPEGQDDSDFYEGVAVDLENNLGSYKESWGDRVLKKSYVEHFEGAAKTYRCGQTFQDRFHMDPYSHHHRDNLYYPFASLQDWELGKFLLCLSLSMAAIDQFLGLELVKMLHLSFCTAKELRGCAELLPSVPKWQYRTMSMTHPTKQLLYLYWHDPLDCIESLFSHPLFAKEIDLTPTRIYDTMERTVRMYSEWMTGDAAWLMQSQLPEGVTLLGVILSSDITNITNMTGGRVAHPLLVSLANIKMATRNKASSHAFLLMALLPITEFLHLVKRLQSVLEAHLIHQCLDVILEPLKQAACVGRMMSDPVGNLRYCFTPLASYIVDTPEACMLACVWGQTSPVTMATYLASIECDPQDIEAYFAACAPFRLSGVARPFWCDWPLADPPHFLTPKALHHWYRAVGAEELDFRFSILQPLTTFQHFKDGISNLKQVTGRTQRDLQCYTVALIADAAPPGIVIAIQALMDFQYLSQAAVMDELHCQKILNALQEFHDHKQDIIRCGARRGAKSKNVLDNWHIHKLELMQSVVPSIHQVGSLLQWSANTTEHAHITLIKDPADSTNNNNVDAQICRFLDCVEKCRNFQTTTSIIIQLSQSANSRTMDNGLELDYEGADVDEADSQAAVTNDLWGPKCPVTNFFKKAAQVSSNIKATRPVCTFVAGSTAIHLNFDPSLRRILEGHSHPYQNFHKLEGQHHTVPDASLPFDDLMVWFKVQVQQASYYSQSPTLPALTINASPPSETRKYSHYDVAIFAVGDTEV